MEPADQLPARNDGGGGAQPVLVALHAHPDDEALFTGGTILRAVEAGWRVVLIVATEGDLGQRPTAASSDLGAHRRAETLAAASILGIKRVVFLGYGDSGCPDASIADVDSRSAQARSLATGTLAAAFVDGAARQVRRILLEEHAVALTSYDDNGIYGHIDHVQVHEIAARSVVGTSCELYEATINRAELRRLRNALVARGLVHGIWPPELSERLGLEDGTDIVAVDVSRHLTAKLAAVSAHASQVLDAGSFMGLPAGAFHHLLGTEWFRISRPGAARFLRLIESTRELEPARRRATSIDQPRELAAVV